MLRQKDESSRVVNVLRSLGIYKSVPGRHRQALPSFEEAAEWTLEHGSGATCRAAGLRLMVSIGLTNGSEARGATALLTRADQRPCGAKLRGRNRVVAG